MVAAMTHHKLTDDQLAALDIPEGCLCEHAERVPSMPYGGASMSFCSPKWGAFEKAEKEISAFMAAAANAAFAVTTYQSDPAHCILCVCRALQRENVRIQEDNERLENEADEAQNKAEAEQSRADDMAATLEIFERKALDLCLSLRRKGDAKQAQLWSDLERQAAEALG